MSYIQPLTPKAHEERNKIDNQIHFTEHSIKIPDVIQRQQRRSFKNDWQAEMVVLGLIKHYN